MRFKHLLTSIDLPFTSIQRLTSFLKLCLHLKHNTLFDSSIPANHFLIYLPQTRSALSLQRTLCTRLPIQHIG